MGIGKYILHFLEPVRVHIIPISVALVIAIPVFAYLIFKDYLSAEKLNWRQFFNKIQLLPGEAKVNLILWVLGLAVIVFFTPSLLLVVFLAFALGVMVILYLLRKTALYAKFLSGTSTKLSKTVAASGNQISQTNEANIPRHLFNIPGPPIPMLLGLLLSVFAVGLFNLIIYNRFFPITEGWWSFYGKYILDGKIPYRDFYLFLPPLYPLQMAAFHSVFGFDFINLRIAGVLISILSTGILYLIYSRLFPPYIAVIVTVLSMFYQISFNAWIPYDFNELLFLYVFVITFCIIRYTEAIIDKNKARRISGLLSLFVVGFLCAVCFLTKQNIGVFVCAASFFLVGIFGMKRGLQSFIKDVAIFWTGFFIPVLICLGWLYSNNALYAFVDQVFLRMDTKGQVKDVLWQWIPRLFNVNRFFYLFLFGSFILLAFYKNYRSLFTLESSDKVQFSYSRNKQAGIFAALFLAYLFSVYYHTFINFHFIHFFKLSLLFEVSLIIAVISTFVIWIICVYKVLSVVSTGDKQMLYDLLVISTMGMTLIASIGTSNAVTHFGLVLSIGLPVGYLILKIKNILWKGLLICACFLLIISVTANKYGAPYRWWFSNEPGIKSALIPSHIKLLEGFHLSRGTFDIINETNAIIDKNTTDSDGIFTYPNIPLFYLMSNRYPPTFGLVHWYDVTPGWVCERDAQALKQHPPKILVIDRGTGDVDLIAHEQIFNNGKFLGQRKILNVLDQLTSDTSRYRLVKKFDTDDSQLSVFQRL